jgi:hypothetical protein
LSLAIIVGDEAVTDAFEQIPSVFARDRKSLAVAGHSVPLLPIKCSAMIAQRPVASSACCARGDSQRQTSKLAMIKAEANLTLPRHRFVPVTQNGISR